MARRRAGASPTSFNSRQHGRFGPRGARVLRSMTRLQNRLAGVSDSRGRIIAIFVGAVLLPSVALSVMSFNAVPKHRAYLKMSLLQQADQLLGYVEDNLEVATRKKALQAARAVGPERLLEGRPAEIRAALQAAGMGDVQFDTFRLEAWSSSRVAGVSPQRGKDI